MDTKNRNALIICILAGLSLAAIYYRQWTRASKALDQFRQTDKEIMASDSANLLQNEEAYNNLNNSNPALDSVHLLVKDYCNYIDSLKEKLVAEAGGRDEEDNIVHRDDIDIATRRLAEGEEGKLLYQKLENLRAYLLSVSAENQAAIQSLLNTRVHNYPGEKPMDWQHASFYHVPVTAAVTILTKFRSDAIKAEQLVLVKAKLNF